MIKESKMDYIETLKAALWLLIIVIVILLGDFLLSLLGSVLYYGVLLGFSVLLVKYLKRKYSFNYDSLRIRKEP